MIRTNNTKNLGRSDAPSCPFSFRYVQLVWRMRKTNYLDMFMMMTIRFEEDCPTRLLFYFPPVLEPLLRQFIRGEENDLEREKRTKRVKMLAFTNHNFCSIQVFLKPTYHT